MISLPSRYGKVVKTLSGGGMSDTIVCLDSNLQREVVVKTLKAGIDEKHLLAELAALQSIRSRYVVQIYDVIRDPTSGTITGIVEEYLTGKPLTPLQAGSSEHDVLRTLFPIASGVSEIHRHDQIHRDLKPENMKYDADGNLRIFDFGLAKGKSAPGTKTLFFSEGYTAPEAFTQDASGLFQYSKAVDTFAFGITAFWIMNQGGIPPELSHCPPSLPCSGLDFSATAVVISSELAALLQRCVDRNPASRPDMGEVVAFLKRHILKDRHRLLIVYQGQGHYLSKDNRKVALSWPTTAAPLAEVNVVYNGFDFIAQDVKGLVSVNNKVIKDGFTFHGAAVIVMGVDDAVNRRVSVTADISHPEVAL